ncbi:MAG: DNA polymerase ligase N-terminal domain-containing protein [Candidatus Altiarchaeota archaeon]
MGLGEYEKKRRLGKTTEPFDSDVSLERPIYVIHEHHASHLHWDLRLEFNGVLRSWAIPKEPPAEAGVKRLAVEVEDHPLSYAGFSGTIPEGEYGAGKVTIWDRGTFDVIEESEDKYVLDIKGEKLRGTYNLIRTNMGGKRRNWLIFRRSAHS